MNDLSLSLGIIGLGSMGAPMAARLLAAHGSLVAYARTPRPELLGAGARWAATPRDLAEQVDAVVLMLPDLPEVRQVLEGPDGLLASGTEVLLLIGSTSSPVELRELAEALSSSSDGRVRVVDCPVSGGVEGARAGTLSIMLGGTPEDCAAARTLLAPCGRALRLGPLGAGQVAKACNQLVVSATILALGEASVLAERSGIELQLLWDLLGSGYAGSHLLEAKKEKLASGDDSPNGIARYMVKDLRFASDVARATHTNAVILPTVQQAFEDIVERGLGERDIAVTRRYIDLR